MRARTSNPDWVQGLRTLLRSSLGPKWQINEHRGRTKLVVRLSDGSRKIKTLPIPWQLAHAREIQQMVMDIAATVNKGKSINEAVQLAVSSRPDAPIAENEPNPNLLLEAWNSWGVWIKGTGEVAEETWKNDYKKTEKRLKEVDTATNAHDLLVRIGAKWDPGIRQRQQAVRQVAKMLRWAVSKEGGFILSGTNWTPPPPGGALAPYIGRKSSKKKAEEEPTVPISDEDILFLLASLPVNHPHPKDKRAAQQWDFAIKAMACWGLRPIEVKHLEVRSNGKDVVWCTYCKKSGGGIGKPRRLWPLHPQWESEWNLIERVANKDPMPPATAGVGEAAGKYLARNKVWQRAKAESGVVTKSFRHAYARRAHQEYGLSDTEAAALMGHTTDTHNKNYAQWTSESMLEKSMERAIKFKKLTN